MKKIAEHVMQEMSKQFEYITMMELRNSPGEVIDSVELGKTFVITKAGRPVAVISKLPGEQLTINVDSKGNISYSR